MKPVQYLISGNKGKRHIIFCAATLALLFSGMWLLYMEGFRFQNLASAFTDCFFFLFCIYTGRWLCQGWYLRHKLAQFILFTILSIAGLSFIKWILIRYIFNHPYAGFFEVFRDAMPFFLIGLVVGILLKLIRVSMQKELLDAQVRAEQKETEFNLLQSQLSPHFLFNVLNNLYGIAIDEHERVPGLLLKLSQLLRYSVYGAKKTMVPLKEEFEYIKNYIDFERIRISDRLVLNCDMEPAIAADIKIAPLILIVFVENAFKHAKNTLTQNIHIHISLKISGNFIFFKVANSYSAEKNADGVANESSGFGLANTLKRLNLLYGDDYELKQHAGKEMYEVELRLKTIDER